MVFTYDNPSTTPKSAGDVMGPILLGVYFNGVLFGALFVQIYSYFQNFAVDPRMLKLFVAYLLVVETLNAGFDFVLVYEPFILRPPDRTIATIPTMLASTGAVTVFISTPVQVYLALRLRAVLQNPVLPSLIIFFSFVSFAGGLATSINIVLARTFANLVPKTWGPVVWLGSSAVADILITGGLCHFLYKRKAGLRLDSVVNRIIISTIQTGGLTAVVAIIDVAIVLTITGAYHFIWSLPLTKLYANALLSTLNARKAWNDLIEEQRRVAHLSSIDIDRALGGRTQPSSTPNTLRRNSLPVMTVSRMTNH